MASERGQVAFLSLGDGAGTTYHRWQSHWLDQLVTWGGAVFGYVGFDWSGVVSGQAAGDQVTLSLPASPIAIALTERALSATWVATLGVYAFPDDGSGDSGPPASMVLVADAIGEIVGATMTQSTVTWRLGSALSPVGAQFPPRSASTPLIGVPCRL